MEVFPKRGRRGAFGGLFFVAGEAIVLAQFCLQKGGGFLGCGLAAEYAADGNRERERKDEGGARLSGCGLHEPREQGFGEAAAVMEASQANMSW